MESTRLQWSGDVDLNDGSLQVQYQAYKSRLAEIKNIGVDSGKHSDVICQLTSVCREISDDLDFVSSGIFYTMIHQNDV